VEVKRLDVRFGSGRDVLNAYWGYLSDGGLVLGNGGDLAEGQSVALDIHIASSNTKYALSGRVVRRQREGQQTVVAFNPGEPHDMLLTAALSEADDVPARRHRRFTLDLPVELPTALDAVVEAAAGVVVRGRVVNISQGGCCLRVEPRDRGVLPVGTTVKLTSDDLEVRGMIVWSRSLDRGMKFDDGTDIKRVRSLMQAR
jgi:hypothetical protein